MKIRTITTILAVFSSFLFHSRGSTSEKQNIVIMLADDMGFGELSCLNPQRGKIPTPQLDRIAAAGMIFNDAHSGSSVCTPTRYGLLTGRYAWRTRLQKGVLTGGESLIAKDRMTLADLLKPEGYQTAIIGKWHLGILFNGKKMSGKVPVGAEVTHGPIDHAGFDMFFGFHHARQMNLWIEDDKVTEEIEHVEMLPKLTKKAVEYIHERKADGRQFLLYVPWNSPHSPVVPTDEWKGKSGINAHADFVMQTDDSFGQIYKALEETGLIENTLVICSSDNGTSPQTSGLKELKAAGHHPSGELRGMKADLWDGGHRVPFIAAWKNVIEPGSRTDALACLTDLMATVADVVGAEYPESAAVDSVSLLPVFNDASKSVRNSVVHHSISGKFAIRDADWKLLLTPGSGGWGSPKDNEAMKQGFPPVQLYRLGKDLGEETNLAEKNPEKVREMRSLLEKQVAAGRSTPGAPQKNDVEVDIDKQSKPRKREK
ncbi:MAG: arylsulfatase [Akkermansiaceae bacterium]